jgi:hypothetical protein
LLSKNPRLDECFELYHCGTAHSSKLRLAKLQYPPCCKYASAITAQGFFFCSIKFDVLAGSIIRVAASAEQTKMPRTVRVQAEKSDVNIQNLRCYRLPENCWPRWKDPLAKYNIFSSNDGCS